MSWRPEIVLKGEVSATSITAGQECGGVWRTYGTVQGPTRFQWVCGSWMARGHCLAAALRC